MTIRDQQLDAMGPQDLADARAEDQMQQAERAMTDPKAVAAAHDFAELWGINNYARERKPDRDEIDLVSELALAMQAYADERVPQGWKLVPREPTQEMLNASQRAIGELSLKHPIGKTPHREIAKTAWQTGYDAAPPTKEPNDDK